MEFTAKFTQIFFFGIGLAAPLLLALALSIVVLGLIVGARESWGRLDAIYWAFITATTVGYGDLRPVKPLSKVLSVITAVIGIIFTGIIVAVAVNAATVSFQSIYSMSEIKVLYGE
ncbi:MAG: two pore domain potassium channel family protein [Proteobacteria bacterium]|nr:two pore domain potassium channel family protein [Pseudomonadota bacterium]